jgi:hypothetical protein
MKTGFDVFDLTIDAENMASDALFREAVLQKAGLQDLPSNQIFVLKKSIFQF